MHPPNRVSQFLEAIASNGSYDLYDLSRPLPKIPQAQSLGLNVNDRVLTFTGIAAGTATPLNLGFDTPSYGFAINCGIRPTAALANIPASGFNVFDLFRIQFQRTNAYRFQTNPVLGGALLGTGQRPGFLQGPCWEFTQGSTLVVTVTPQVANLDIDIMLRTLEVIGPTNME